LRTIARWTPIHAVLLTGGGTFGYLMLSGSPVMAMVGGLAGTLIALLASRELWSRTGKDQIPLPHAGLVPQAARSI
jgi:hypothetical protein